MTIIITVYYICLGNGRVLWSSLGRRMGLLSWGDAPHHTKARVERARGGRLAPRKKKRYEVHMILLLRRPELAAFACSVHMKDRASQGLEGFPPGKKA
jgi:hypothetical protein